MIPCWSHCETFLSAESAAECHIKRLILVHALRIPEYMCCDGWSYGDPCAFVPPALPLLFQTNTAVAMHFKSLDT